MTTFNRCRLTSESASAMICAMHARKHTPYWLSKVIFFGTGGFTRRQAVVRLKRQIRLPAAFGSCCASRRLNSRSSSVSKAGGNGTCRMTPRLRRLSVSRLTAPLSRSKDDGATASISEMRPPVHRRVRQKRPIRGGARTAARSKRIRSAALRDFFRYRMDRRASGLRGAAPASLPRAETEWPIMFQHGEVFAKLQRICAQPCRYHADFFILHGRFVTSKFCTKIKDFGAPEEIRTPDPQIRSLVLYPAELRALCASHG
jgi:hypothetical protein